jgi:hypothetical protein
MSRVTDENGHIEHWHPQSQSRGKRDKRDLDYANLLLVCAGGANHCDVAKGDKQLKFNPADSRHNVESRIRYHANGRIECSDDAEFDNQIQKTLNLNAAHLVENRRVVGDDARRRAGECTSLLALNNLRKRALKANRDGALKPFCMVSVYFIDKKIRKLQAQKQHEKR